MAARKSGCLRGGRGTEGTVSPCIPPIMSAAVCFSDYVPEDCMYSAGTAHRASANILLGRDVDFSPNINVD